MKVFCSLAIAFYLFGAAMAVCGSMDGSAHISQTLSEAPCLSKQFTGAAITCGKLIAITSCPNSPPKIEGEAKFPNCILSKLNVDTAEKVLQVTILTSSLNKIQKPQAIAQAHKCFNGFAPLVHPIDANLAMSYISCAVTAMQDNGCVAVGK